MRYSAYEQYKDSGIEWLGEIPLFWKMTSLKRNIVLNPSKSEVVHKKFVKCSFIPMESLKTDSLAIDDERIIETVYDGYTYFKDGDLLLAKVTPCFENRNIAIANELKNGIGFGSTEIYVIRPNQKIHARFLFYYVQNEQFIQFAKEHMTGAGGLKRIPSDFLINIEFPDISIDEQQKIADFLDKETAKIDTLLKKQKKLIQLLEEKRQAEISHAVTKGLNPNVKMKDSGVEWLGEIPEHWSIPRIKQIVSIPVTDGPHETPNFVDEGVPFVSAEAVSKGFLNFDKIRGFITEQQNAIYSLKYSPKKYDIYMVKSGATTGVTAIVEEDKLFNIWSPLAVIRCKKNIYHYFVLNFMRSHEFLKAIELNWSFGTQQNIGMGVIENLHIASPPLNEAIEISDYLSNRLNKFNQLIEKVNNQILLMKERKTALISAAVTGKIDVRNIT